MSNKHIEVKEMIIRYIMDMEDRNILKSILDLIMLFNKNKLK